MKNALGLLVCATVLTLSSTARADAARFDVYGDLRVRIANYGDACGCVIIKKPDLLDVGAHANVVSKSADKGEDACVEPLGCAYVSKDCRYVSMKANVVGDCDLPEQWCKGRVYVEGRMCFTNHDVNKDFTVILNVDASCFTEHSQFGEASIVVGEPTKPLIVCGVAPNGKNNMSVFKPITVKVPAGKSVVVPLSVFAQADVH